MGTVKDVIKLEKNPAMSPLQAAHTAEFRALMPVTANWAYFDHAAVAPLPRGTRQVIEQWVAQAAEQGDVPWLNWSRGVERCRSLAAQLIGSEPSEIALVPNTTAGIGLVAEGFPWKLGDNVVLPNDEFPSNQYPWMNLATRGVEVRRIAMPAGRLDLDCVAAACDAHTRIVSLSWVSYAQGWRTDVAAAVELIHAKGALCFLDAIQGLGVFPLDVGAVPVDFLAADGHKWLLGPEGAGICYIRGKHLDLLRPTGVGWNSVTAGHDFSKIAADWKPSAARYEGGSLNMSGFLGLAKSLELLLRFGTEWLSRAVLEFTGQLAERLRSLGAEIHSLRDNPEGSSGILSFSLPGRDPAAVRQRCLDRGVVLSCRGGRLRASPHAYHTDEDLERITAAIKSFV